MKLAIANITNAINKISDITNGDKTIPGILFSTNKTDGLSKIKVCYSDGHKSLIEEIDAEFDATDTVDEFVVDYEMFKRAIDNCQPSGIIKVNDITLSFKDNVITVSAEQFMDIAEDSQKKMAVKKMDVAWIAPGSDMKSSILSRMKYDEIFNAGEDEEPDQYDKAELVDALNRTSVEKGRQIYFSNHMQSVFVSNQAHVTNYPIKQNEITTEEQDEIRAEILEKEEETGKLPDDTFDKTIENIKNKIHYSIIINQSMAKALANILNKVKSNTVYIYRKDTFCNIYMIDDTEKVGIWFEMAAASKVHIGALERFSSLAYSSYQLMFIREFVDSAIKSALSSTKSAKVEFKFRTNPEDGTVSLVIKAGSASASTSDEYDVACDDVVDVANNIDTKTFMVSLDVFAAMMGQLKSDRIALDIEIAQDGTSFIRLAEIDNERLMDEYKKAREGLDDTTPTPLQSKIGYRNRILNVTQYTALSK